MARPTFAQAIGLIDNYFSRQPIQQLIAYLSSGARSDGSTFYMPGYVAEWQEDATATAAAATATRAAGAAGMRHYITAIRASYGAAQIGAVSLQENGIDIVTFHVHNQRDIVFSQPLRMPSAALSAGAVLSAGAAGVVGQVDIEGFTQ